MRINLKVFFAEILRHPEIFEVKKDDVKNDDEIIAACAKAVSIVFLLTDDGKKFLKEARGNKRVALREFSKIIVADIIIYRGYLTTATIKDRGEGMIKKCFNHFSIDFDEFVTFTLIELVKSAAFYDEVKGRRLQKPKQVPSLIIISNCDYCELGPSSQDAIAI